MRFALCLAAAVAVSLALSTAVQADGLVRKPRNYLGSLEERGQEAIIVFQEGKEGSKSTEDLILKIRVEGEAKNFAWIIPFPSEPKIAKEDPKLFQELFAYVQAKQTPKLAKTGAKSAAPAAGAATEAKNVEVISRQVVGDFDIAVVRENQAGGLNPWLEKEGFQTLEMPKTCSTSIGRRSTSMPASRSPAPPWPSRRISSRARSASRSPPADGTASTFR